MFFAQQQHHHLSSNSISISSVTTKRIRQSRRTFSTGRTAVVRAAGAADGGDGNVKFANNKAEWDAVTGGNDGLIAVQISTKTCGPCKVIYPTFVGLSEEFAEKATFVKIMGDTDTESRALMKEWGVRVVPLFMLWKNGEKIAEWSGAKPDVLRENVTSAM
ncbi:unnamed protein product [Bathycoccus prasinos]|mmetsp:Transcript_2671/g.8564  ORF Transcript_2671/g.8564 Transcript_2671/m.8564 type:complete len:161 (+) Transcript_2671:97-579(+)